MKRLASVLGLRELGLLLAGTLLFGMIGTAVSAALKNQAGQQGLGAWSVVQAALFAETHMGGPGLNVFTPQAVNNADAQLPSFSVQKLLQGIIDDGNVPGNVQCVDLVKASYALANHPLPAAGNAIDFWGLYAARQGWQEIPTGHGLPLPGDIMVWAGGLFGHVAIVVAVNPPTGGKDGSVVVAQANAPPTFVTQNPDPQRPWLHVPAGIPLYEMPLSPSLQISTWDGYQVLGVIRNNSLYTTQTLAQSAPGTYAVMGSPTITPEHIDRILTAAGSPAAGTGLALYNLGMQYHIDPIYALAFFQHESSFGTSGVARLTLGLGNIRCTPGYACIDGFRAYSSWEAGYQDWYLLISQQYIARGLITLDQIIPVYAPSVENDTQGYIASVERAITQWRSEP